MSACWASERPGTRTRLALGLAGLTLLLATAVAAAAAKAEHVRIGPGTIVVDGRDEDDSTRVQIGDEQVSRRGHGWIDVDDRGDALVRVFGDIRVPPGKRVHDDVVAVFGSVDVEGHVDGEVVAVLGSVRVRDGAQVDGEVVSVGGSVDQEDGGIIEGQTVSVGFLPASWGAPALPIALGAIGAGLVTAVFAGWILALLFPSRLVRIAATASRRTGASLMLGVVSVPGFVALCVLMLVTVVGIPLAFLLPFAYVIMCYAGQLAAGYVLGCKLVGRSIGRRGLVWPMVAGALLVAAFFAVGAVLFVVPGVARPVALFSALLGCLLVVALTAIGTGAILLSRFGTQPKEVSWAPEPASAASPIPASPPIA